MAQEHALYRIDIIDCPIDASSDVPVIVVVDQREALEVGLAHGPGVGVGEGGVRGIAHIAVRQPDEGGRHWLGSAADETRLGGVL